MKRLNGICAQVLPYLSQEVSAHTHTQRHKDVTDPQPYSLHPGMRSPSFPPHYFSISVTPRSASLPPLLSSPLPSSRHSHHSLPVFLSTLLSLYSSLPHFPLPYSVYPSSFPSPSLFDLLLHSHPSLHLSLLHHFSFIHVCVCVCERNKWLCDSDKPCSYLPTRPLTSTYYRTPANHPFTSVTQGVCVRVCTCVSG